MTRARTWLRGPACWMLLALTLCTLLGALNLRVAQGHATGVVLLGPVVACLRLGPRPTAAVAGWALLIATAPATTAPLWPELYGSLDAGFPLRTAALCAACGLAVYAAAQHTALRASLAQVTRVAAAAQSAIMRPLPPCAGGVSFAVRERAAVRQSAFCGDVYAAVETPFGVRLLVADVSGHSLDTIRPAAAVVAGFRDLAASAPTLTELARALDTRLLPELGPEDFVTAVFAEFDAGEVTLVNCGHPAPVRKGGGRVRLLEPHAVSPPLGLHPSPEAYRFRFQGGDRLLFYTDGLTDAAADGPPLPLLELAGRALGEPLAADALARLEKLAGGGRRTDDLLLVLCQPVDDTAAHSTTISTGMLPRVARE
ncbi:hypothetical protein SRB5_38660 [Streptomyces sp. RB5]|uniref:PPM-type phosphatase domain-containing protein n=1 Tax=Streptomyces smaragdinus TaxID=2585196 RepID=A0A7K0CJP9_9ACTN|nr:PP2C family protein-serine/threonine phosphatase [Streptomyces smaragdinus]MQY13715.1 hypothetical protein [Streptomyces smaragdinus]